MTSFKIFLVQAYGKILKNLHFVSLNTHIFHQIVISQTCLVVQFYGILYSIIIWKDIK